MTKQRKVLQEFAFSEKGSEVKLARVRIFEPEIIDGNISLLAQFVTNPEEDNGPMIAIDLDTERLRRLLAQIS